MKFLFSILAALGLTSQASEAEASKEPSEAELARKSYIESVSADPTEAQLARKEKSIAEIERLGLPYAENLPVIEDETKALRRSDEEVAARALAVMITAVKGETRDQALIESVVEQYGAWELFTPEERAFIEAVNLPDEAYVQMSWRYESVAVLLWAIGLIEELPAPDQIIDAAMLGSVFRELGAEGLIQKARLRPQSEILDAADLAYRLHWAAVEARVNGAPSPDGLHPGIAYERHYALNWLIGYAGLDWDNMATDT
ncbi:MAG: DUF4272 domain-containing protein [Pseudomonadota bacterium]